MRVTALDGKEKAQEIGSDGRVREFIRHVCGDDSDVFVDPYAEQNKPFLLPRWPTGRGIGARMAQWWLPPANGDESSPLTLEETEHFILGTEEILIKNLRRAIAHAHRLALVEQANVVITTSSSHYTGINVANASQKAQTRLITPRRSDKRSFRMSVIFKAIEFGKKGLEYCSFLRDHGLTTPEDWQLDGCDANYVLAYQDSRQRRRKFRALIYKEKTRHSRLLSNLRLNDLTELERIKKVGDKESQP